MISKEQLTRLAKLYAEYQHSLKPLSPERATAGRAFQKLLEQLHAAHAAGVPFDQFRRAVVERCREYLRKNKAS